RNRVQICKQGVKRFSRRETVSMNIEHPLITEINRYGYPLEYLKDEKDAEREGENGSKAD
ncbi:hypothetical protein, partial [Bacillus glycinifermentans]|uniref:hypothetical protein n=1 Tax=Bacillus glycinifermentans TaxID=1664069 RepID=UPI002DBDDE86